MSRVATRSSARIPSVSPKPVESRPPPPRRRTEPLISGSIKELEVNVYALDQFVGQAIYPPDGQAKAAVMRFIAGSPLLVQQGGDQKLEGGCNHDLEKKDLGINNEYYVREERNLDPRALGKGLQDDDEDGGAHRPSPKANAADVDNVNEHNPKPNNDRDMEDVPGICPPPQSIVAPTFNKMSGMQHFKNAVALFVNLDGTTYSNFFLRGGNDIGLGPGSLQLLGEDLSAQPLMMTFDAQPTHTLETPIVQAIIAMNRGGGKVGGDEAGGANELVNAIIGKKRARRGDDGDGDDEDDIQPSSKKRKVVKGKAAPKGKSKKGGKLKKGDYENCVDIEGVVNPMPRDLHDLSDDDVSVEYVTADPPPQPCLAVKQQVPAVVLFCRFEGGPYVYWGRLGLRAYADRTKTVIMKLNKGQKEAGKMNIDNEAGNDHNNKRNEDEKEVEGDGDVSLTAGFPGASRPQSVRFLFQVLDANKLWKSPAVKHGLRRIAHAVI